MFSHRFKIEIRENRIYLILWALVLAIMSISAISYWNAEIKLDPETGRPENSVSDFISLLMIPLIAIPIVGTITTFRLDNLKDPRAFWNTRPIRPTVLHTTKFVFLHLAFTLPLAICTLIIGLNATSPGTAFIYTAEAILWCAAAIHLSALSALHNHEWSKLLLIPAVGLIGIMITAFIAARFELIGHRNYDPARSASNLLFTILLLLIIFVIAGGALIKKPRIKFPLWAPFLLGSLTVPLLSAGWFPTFSPKKHVVEYTPADPVLDFNTTSLRYNQQHYLLLNYEMKDLLPESDRIPLNLLSQQIDEPSDFEFETPFRAEIRAWQSGSSRLPGPKNLQSMASNLGNEKPLRLTLSLMIPHENGIQRVPNFDDIPRKEVTVEGEFRLATVDIEDALTIVPGKQFRSESTGRSFTYIPATKKGQSDSILSKSFTLPMASSGLVGMSQRYYGQSPLVFMKHRDTDQYFLLDEGSSSSRGGVFGSVSYHELRDPEDSHIVSYEWKNRFQKNIPDLPDFEEWKKNADLMILSAENFENITVPFKVTVSLPDPDLVQERLNSLSE